MAAALTRARLQALKLTFRFPSIKERMNAGATHLPRLHNGILGDHRQKNHNRHTD
jgi:hypothetical protein